jgi:3-oxoacyl-[acyl-carrier protein] reductase
LRRAGTDRDLDGGGLGARASSKAIPARRIGRPEEVAELVAYLFSDLAAYVTRQVIRIDGDLS